MYLHQTTEPKKKGKLTKLKGEIKFNNYSCNNDLSVNNIKN